LRTYFIFNRFKRRGLNYSRLFCAYPINLFSQNIPKLQPQNITQHTSINRQQYHGKRRQRCRPKLSKTGPQTPTNVSRRAATDSEVISTKIVSQTMKTVRNSTSITLEKNAVRRLNSFSHFNRQQRTKQVRAAVIYTGIANPVFSRRGGVENLFFS